MNTRPSVRWAKSPATSRSPQSPETARSVRRVERQRSAGCHRLRSPERRRARSAVGRNIGHVASCRRRRCQALGLTAAVRGDPNMAGPAGFMERVQQVCAVGSPRGCGDVVLEREPLPGAADQGRSSRGCSAGPRLSSRWPARPLEPSARGRGSSAAAGSNYRAYSIHTERLRSPGRGAPGDLARAPLPRPAGHR